AAAGGAALPSPAHARVVFGFGFGVPIYPPPIYVPPPVYYPPPTWYVPPPPTTYAPPPAGAPSPVRQSCRAGAYMCPMDRPTTPGASCYCLGNNGQRVWGRAD
ncbi:MAG: hypothetical protein AB7S57_22865, partial [Acetobacteraceae bacterium]